jgi:hypothetical protein
MENTAKDSDVIAFEPDQTIRNLIGQDTKLSEIFTAERIEACQNTIDSARGAFFDVAYEDLAKLEALVKDRGTSEISEAMFEETATHAANIKGHAELFGFALIAAIGSHIVAYSEPGPYAPSARFRLITDLVKMLHIAIEQKIIDENGALARELNASLKTS